MYLHVITLKTKAWTKSVHTNIKHIYYLPESLHKHKQSKKTTWNIVFELKPLLSYSKFRNVMPLWLSGWSLLWSSLQCGVGKSVHWGLMSTAKEALARPQVHMNCAIWDRATAVSRLAYSSKTMRQSGTFSLLFCEFCEFRHASLVYNRQVCHFRCSQFSITVKSNFM